MNRLNMRKWIARIAVALLLAVGLPASVGWAKEKDPRLEQVLVLEAEATAHYKAGRYDETIPLLQRALTLRETALGKDHESVASTLRILAALYRSQGDYNRALPLLERAFRIYEELQGEEHPNVATIVNGLANLYQKKGDYERARRHYLRALSLREKVLGEDHRKVAEILNNLALNHQATADFDLALPLLQRALGIVEKAYGKDHPSVATTLSNLAGLHRARGQLHRALPLYRRALSIFELARGRDHSSVAVALNNLAQLTIDTGAYTRALPLLERALRIEENTLGKDHPDVAITLNNLATLQWARNKQTKALGLFQRSMAIEHAHMEHNLKQGTGREHLAFVKRFEGSLDQVISLLLGMGPTHEEAQGFGAEMVLRGKARATGASLRSSRNTRRQVALFELVQATQSKLSALSYRADGDPEEIRSLKARLEVLQRRLSSVGQQTEADVQPSVAGLKRLLNENTALIEWVVYQPFDPRAKKEADRYGEPHLAAVVIRSGKTPRWFALGEVAQLQPAMAKLRKAVSTQRWDFKTAAQPVAKQIFSPLEPALEGIDTLILSPDGPLHRVPFAALVDAQGRWLSARFQLRQVTTGRDVFALTDTTFEPRQPPLVLADPHFDRSGTSGESVAAAPAPSQRGVSRATMAALRVRRLMGTKREAETLSALLGLPAERVKLGVAASEGALRSVKGPTFVHIATHGFFLAKHEGTDADPNRASDDAMLLSGLTFAGFNNRKMAENPDDDGLLTALELGGLDLTGTELVVLSACETGLGEVETGEGVFGLKRALSLAGARTQVVSLWKVDDKATQALMTAYYGRLLKGEDRVEALRRVQLDMLHGRLAESPDAAVDPSDEVLVGWRHPYYWAAFTVSGAAGPIALK
jgi:CHAT domain-containing protein/tetratricopeptide (TPR) repeat protein